MRFLLVNILILFFFGCKQKERDADMALESLPISKLQKIEFTSPERLIEYVDNANSGYLKNKEIDNIIYSSVLKPAEYLLAQKKLSSHDSSLKVGDFEDLQYFDLRITVKDFKQEFIKYDLLSTNQYQERVNYCAFGMQNDIVLIDGKDTLPCVLFHYERAYDVTPYGHFLLGFEKTNKNTIDARTLCFNDKLFNKGIIKFTYSPVLLAKDPVVL